MSKDAGHDRRPTWERGPPCSRAGMVPTAVGQCPWQKDSIQRPPVTLPHPCAIMQGRLHQWQAASPQTLESRHGRHPGHRATDRHVPLACRAGGDDRWSPGGRKGGQGPRAGGPGGRVSSFLCLLRRLILPRWPRPSPVHPTIVVEMGKHRMRRETEEAPGAPRRIVTVRGAGIC